MGATGTYLMNGQALDALAFRVVLPPPSPPCPTARRRASSRPAGVGGWLAGDCVQGLGAVRLAAQAKCQGSRSAHQLAVPAARA